MSQRVPSSFSILNPKHRTNKHITQYCNNRKQEALNIPSSDILDPELFNMHREKVDLLKQKFVNQNKEIKD